MFVGARDLGPAFQLEVLQGRATLPELPLQPSDYDPSASCTAAVRVCSAEAGVAAAGAAAHCYGTFYIRQVRLNASFLSLA